MRKLTGYVCIMLYVIGLLKPIAPIIEFELQKDYIQKFLCEKRTQPITVCGGSCYLKLKLAESSNEQSETSKFKISLEDYPIGFVDIYSLPISHNFLTKPKGYRIDQYTYLTQINILQPPRA